MNYIKHLTAVYEKFAEDDRLNPSHVSLYMALFQFWNLNRFRNPVSIARGEVMKLSKIASNKTYLKGLRELDQWGYIRYFPSRNPMKGSKVEICNFYTSTTQVVNKHYTSATQVLPPSINNSKLNKQRKREKTEFHPPSLEEVKFFFEKNMAGAEESEAEARRFHNHYQANGWRVGQNEMQNWPAAAENWLLKIPEFRRTGKHSTGGGSSSTGGHLNANQNKDYGEPL